MLFSLFLDGCLIRMIREKYGKPPETSMQHTEVHWLRGAQPGPVQSPCGRAFASVCGPCVPPNPGHMNRVCERVQSYMGWMPLKHWPRKTEKQFTELKENVFIDVHRVVVSLDVTPHVCA